MATVPDESREHKLIDTVIDRILAVSRNEAKLTALLDKYLTPLLLKAESPHASVREKAGRAPKDGQRTPANLCIGYRLLQTTQDLYPATRVSGIFHNL